MYLSNRSYPPAHDMGKADQIWATLQNYCEKHTISQSFIPQHRKLIETLAGNSPYLAKLIELDVGYFIRIIGENPTNLLHEALAGLKSRPDGETTAELMTALRLTKARVALLVAVMDVSGTWPLMQLTKALSDFAEDATAIATAHILHTYMIKGDLAWPRGKEEPVTPALADNSGFFVLGLGKLGAGELNYSSDIDLIVLFDDMVAKYQGQKSMQDCFTRITKDIVQIIDQRTMDGYVFRTDLRLRPDPSATPVALSVSAAEHYYHSLAQNWERSAMIKAKVVAGDSVAGKAYLKRLSGWVWRRSMDYEALKEIHAIKHQILRHYGQEKVQFKNFNVKLGQGGIREIEFYAQVNQLVYGGKNINLRERATLKALIALVEAAVIPQQVCDDLSKAYIYFRDVEHRLQMINDEQTHSIPKNDDMLKRVATFMGEASVDAFEQTLFQHSECVKKHYDALMPKEDGDPIYLSGQALIDRLENLGFANSKATADLIETWQRGRYKSLRTQRARDLLNQCLDGLLVAFSNTSEPNAALARFDRFIEDLPAGVQVFSLFKSNPKLFNLIARILGLAPALAEQLARRPTLWEAVLDPYFFSPLPTVDPLRKSLNHALNVAQDHQDILDITRRWVAEHKFRIGVHVLESLADVKEAGLAMSHLADATLLELLPRVEADFQTRHGTIEGGGIALLAMGKYGGKELTYISDLDVVFLYNVPDMNAMSNGKKPLAPSQYYSRLGQTIITAIMSPTAEGRLFEVDTRLRPSGNAGPLVVTLKTFTEYYQDPNRAWTWEHMALTRARPIVCPPEMLKPLKKAIVDTLTLKRDQEELLNRVAKMRHKMRKEFTTNNVWSVKHAVGGLVDMEFICQYLMLKYGQSDKDIFSPYLDEAFEKMEEKGYIPEGTAKTIAEAHSIQQSIQSLLRLCVGGSKIKEEDFSIGLKDVLVKGSHEKTFKSLKKTLLKSQSNIKKIYDTVIEKIYLKQNDKKDS